MTASYGVCKVFIASDDAKAIQQLTHMSDKYQWIYHDMDTVYYNVIVAKVLGESGVEIGAR